MNANRHALGEITEAQQVLLFEKVYPEYVHRTELYYNKHTNNLPNRVPFDQLDNNLKEVLVDTVYQGLARTSTYEAAANNDPRELGLNILARSGEKYNERNRDRLNYMGVAN